MRKRKQKERESISRKKKEKSQSNEMKPVQSSQGIIRYLAILKYTRTHIKKYISQSIKMITNLKRSLREGIFLKTRLAMKS